MNSWRTWLARLGLAGACALVGGCGGGVPDPSSDPQAAAEPPADGGAAPIGPKADAAPPAAAPETASAKRPRPTRRPRPRRHPPRHRIPHRRRHKVARPRQRCSRWQRVRAIRVRPRAGHGGPVRSAGRQCSAPGSRWARRPAAGRRGWRRPGGMGMMPMAPGRGGGQNPGDMAKMMQQNQANMQMQMKNRSQQQSGQAGMPGREACRVHPVDQAAAMLPRTTAPVTSRVPVGAVRAFLSAVKAKDADRLNEATAIRAPEQAESSKNRVTFKKIADLALSDSEFDELAKNLEGYRVMGENPQKIIGRVNVIARKQGQNGSYSHAHVHCQARKERLGRDRCQPIDRVQSHGRDSPPKNPVEPSFVSAERVRPTPETVPACVHRRKCDRSKAVILTRPSM